MRGGSLDINSRPAPEDSADEAPLIRIARIMSEWDPKDNQDRPGKSGSRGPEEVADETHLECPRRGFSTSLKNARKTRGPW